jgi:type I restriction-modification system DNA methylase subunit
MELVFRVSESRQPVWIERLNEAIQKNQAELDAQLPSFEAIELEYLEWKSKIDRLKSTITADKYDLDTFVQSEKAKKAPVHGKIIEGTKKFRGGNGDVWKASTWIRWEEVIRPILKKVGHFIGYKELWELVKVQIGDTSVNKRRYYVAASGKSNSWRSHEKKLGLIEWFDGDTIKAEFLNDFLNDQRRTASS